jgi:hypothetical protein
LAPRRETVRGAAVITKSRFHRCIAASPKALAAQPFTPQIVPLRERRRGCRLASWSPPMWILLLVPFVGLLWVPFYNFQEPALFGFPFFYWYQLVWVPISSLLIWLVYRSRARDEAP